MLKILTRKIINRINRYSNKLYSLLYKIIIYDSNLIIDEESRKLKKDL